jgi:hypothetical protein
MVVDLAVLDNKGLLGGAEFAKIERNQIFNRSSLNKFIDLGK